MKIRREFIVGIFAAIAIAALILGFFFMKGQTLFGDKKEYYVVYQSADGLAVGNAVKLNGVQVGKVTNIILNPKDVNSTVVRIEITNEDLEIPFSTIAEMKGDILGTITINLIYPEIQTSKYHNLGDTLNSAVAENIQETIEKKFDPLMVKINELIGTADQAINTINSIFASNEGSVNSAFGKLDKSMTYLLGITKNVDSLTNTLAQNRYKIVEMIDNVNAITYNIKESNEEITNVIKNFSELSDSLKGIDINGIVNKANNALTGVNLILDEIQNGDGTLTKLMQDSLLYDNLNLMIDEATSLVDNIKTHPNRYLQFAVFGGKDKGLKLPNKDEKMLRQYINDSIKPIYR